MIPPTADDNEKGSKYQAGKPTTPNKFQSYKEAQNLFSLQALKLSSFVMGNAFFACLCALAVGCVILLLTIVGAFSSEHRDSSVIPWIVAVSQVAEMAGLFSLRLKIKRQGSVKGVSGMTIIMYSLVYAIRAKLVFPYGGRSSWAEAVPCFLSLLVVLDTAKCIFWTYHSSYQQEQDVLRVKYLIPGCLLLAGVLHPVLPNEGAFNTFIWTTELYLDVLALMPQVVMMSRGDGRVEAPIAHFVAATALARAVDLSIWFWSYSAFVEYYSCVMVMFWQCVMLLLITDFLYLYLKARISKPLSPIEEIQV